LRRLFKRKAPRWRVRTEELPWFDRPDAEQWLQARRREGSLAPADLELLADWLADGYCILRRAVPHETIDAMLADLEAVWTAERPIGGLHIHDLRPTEGEVSALSHEELLALPLDERLRLRAASPWRILGFHYHSAAARALFEHAALRRCVSVILGRPAEPVYSINFMYGSRQRLHQDTAVFQVHPPNFLVGVWIACEDIAPESGPLLYYPGSHRVPLWGAFDNYPETSLKTCDAAARAAYEAHLERARSAFPERVFLGRKGDALFWHGMLIHGGAAVEKPGLTRKSFVLHYIPPGLNRAHEIVGRMNW